MYRRSYAWPLLDRLIRWIGLGAIFLVPVLPLYVPGDMIYPTVTGRGFVLRLLVEIAASAWLVLALRQPTFRPRTSPVVVAGLGLWVAITISTVLSVDPVRSMFGSLERMEGWVGLTHLLAFGCVATLMLRSERLWERWFLLSAGVSSLVALLGLGEFLYASAIDARSHRVQASLGNPAYFAAYLLGQLFLCLFLIARRPHHRVRRLLLELAVLVHVGALFAAGTRSAMLGLVMGLVSTVLLVHGARHPELRPRTRRAAWALAIVLPVALLTGLAVYTATAGGARAELGSVEVTSGVSPSSAADAALFGPRFGQLRRLLRPVGHSLSARVGAWQAAGEAFLVRPVFGWGPEAADIAVERFPNPLLLPHGVFTRPHNVLLQWAVMTGSVGLLAYLALLSAGLRMAWLSSRERAMPVWAVAWLVGLVVSLFANDQLLFDIQETYVVTLAVLAYLHVISTGTPGDGTELHLPSRQMIPRHDLGRCRPRTGGWVVLPVVAATVAVGWWLNVPDIRAARAATAASPDAPGTALERFGRLVAGLESGRHGDELRRELMELAAGIWSNERLPETERRRVVQIAVAQARNAIDRSPGRLRERESLGRFLLAVGRYSEARILLEGAAQEVPGRALNDLSLATLYDRTGHRDAMVRSAWRALHFAPREDEPRLVLSAGLWSVGATDTAVRLIQSVAWLPTEAQIDRLVATLSAAPPAMGLGDASAGGSRVRPPGSGRPWQAWVDGLTEFFARRGQLAGAPRRLRQIGRLLPSAAAACDRAAEELMRRANDLRAGQP